VRPDISPFESDVHSQAHNTKYKIALLDSLGILEGFFHMRQVCLRNKEKNTFLLILSVLGWLKLLDLDCWSRKFPRLNIFARKKISMLERTLTTPSV